MIILLLIQILCHIHGEQYGTQEKVRLTGYNKIILEGTINGDARNFKFFISNEKVDIEKAPNLSEYCLKIGSLDDNKKIDIIDISDIEGEYYIGFLVSNVMFAQIDKIYLEK